MRRAGWGAKVGKIRPRSGCNVVFMEIIQYCPVSVYPKLRHLTSTRVEIPPASFRLKAQAPQTLASITMENCWAVPTC